MKEFLAKEFSLSPRLGLDKLFSKTFCVASRRPISRNYKKKRLGFIDIKFIFFSFCCTHENWCLILLLNILMWLSKKWWYQVFFRWKWWVLDADWLKLYGVSTCYTKLYILSLIPRNLLFVVLFNLSITWNCDLDYKHCDNWCYS